MPISINLLQEEQLQAVAHIYDPLKIVLRISYAVVGALLLWIGFMFFNRQRIESELKRVRAEWEQIRQNADRLRPIKEERLTIHTKLLAYAQYSSQRLLWGSELEMLRKLVPPEIYLTDIMGGSEFKMVPRPPPKGGGAAVEPGQGGE